MVNSSYDQFVGTYHDVITDDFNLYLTSLYDDFQERGLTMTTYEETYGNLKTTSRKDNAIYIPSGIPSECFPQINFQGFWDNLRECVKDYQYQYNFDTVELSSYNFMMHKSEPRGGYHVWHKDTGPNTSTRILTWLLYITVPDEGGETEFLNQSLRCLPEKNKLVIFPSGFTHIHRGNPSLKGSKLYLTGYFIETGAF